MRVRNSETGKVFARKLIRLAGDVNEQDINNEMRAVVSLCMSHNPHENIITVFQCGCLTPPWYYIDMELCEYNLEVWIRRRVNGNGNTSSTSSTREQSRMAQIWGIMSDIIRGVMYIHQQKQIHRDLKPRNVLYSQKEDVWKLTDFGLTKEGSSQIAHVTQYSRGSECYRAPELLFGDRYTNKVDIWPLGCILHELVFGARAFSNDFAASRYADSGKDFAVPPIPDDISDEEKREFIHGIIRELLSIEGTQRPSARSLYERWEPYSLAIQATPTVIDDAPLASHLAPLDPVLPPVSISHAPNVGEQSRAGLQIPLASISAEIVMDRNCVGWSLNSTGTLLVMTIYSKLDGRTIELWDVAKVKRIWKTYAVNLASTTFSPNGELLGIFISGSTLRYTDHPISMPSTVEIYNVRNSLVKQSQGRIFMDAGMYQQTSTDRTLPDSFTITNTGLQRAVSLCDSQDSSYHLQQTGVNNRPNSIHVLHSPSKCLLQYSEDGRRLYCVTTTEDSFASKLILRVWNTEEGTIEAICTNKLYGLPLTNDFGKMLQTQDLAVFAGAHLVFLVRRQKIGQSGDVNCVVIINEGDLTAVYSRPTYPSVHVLSGRLFVDLERKTISNTPNPRGADDLFLNAPSPLGDPTRQKFENLPSLPLENDLVPVGLYGGYLIVLDQRTGVLTRFIPKDYHWFPSQHAFPESTPHEFFSS